MIGQARPRPSSAFDGFFFSQRLGCRRRRGLPPAVYIRGFDVYRHNMKPCFCLINGCKQSDVFLLFLGKYGESDLESFTENKIFYI